MSEFNKLNYNVTIRAESKSFNGRANLESDRLSGTIGAPEQNDADALKEKIRRPHQQLRVPFRSRFQGLSENKKTVVNQHEHERDGDAEAGLAPVRANAEWDADECESNARKRKRKLPV